MTGKGGLSGCPFFVVRVLAVGGGTVPPDPGGPQITGCGPGWSRSAALSCGGRVSFAPEERLLRWEPFPHPESRARCRSGAFAMGRPCPAAAWSGGVELAAAPRGPHEPGMIATLFYAV
jgi:hypothetical protein